MPILLYLRVAVVLVWWFGFGLRLVSVAVGPCWLVVRFHGRFDAIQGSILVVYLNIFSSLLLSLRDEALGKSLSSLRSLALPATHVPLW